MNDVEDRVRAALTARAAITEPSYDAAEEFAERIGRARKQRRHRMLAVAAGVIAILAIALSLTLQLDSRESGAPPAAPVTLRPPAPVPSESRSAAGAIAAPPVIADHSLFAGMLNGDHTTVFDAQSGRKTGSLLIPRAEAVAGWPGHGWLVAQKTDDGCHSALGLLEESRFPNKQSDLLIAPAPELLDEIVASPDGRRLAAVERSCASGSVDLLVIDLVTGTQRRWTLPDATMNAVNGLTWSSDSSRLAYTAGVNTGGGLGGGYAELDVRTAGGSLSAVLPGTGQVEIGDSRCQVDRGLWLGTTGHFAVFAYCPNSDALFLAQVPFGSAAPHGEVIASLPGEGATMFPDASVTDDGQHLLLTTDNATYRIDDRKVFRLDGHWRSPSW
jgi:hypothetical protein